MKKFAKLFVVALVVTLIASLFAIQPSAATADPHNLKVTSNNVIFVMDAPEGQELPGDGSGLSPENPLKPIDHEKFNPEDEAPRYYYQTALYQATELLQDTGGTVVIMGYVNIGPGDIYGNAATTCEFMSAYYKTNTVKFTSVWNGVDYRETNGAKLEIEFPAMFQMNGQTIFENIDIATIGTNRLIAFNHYSALMGEGVNCYPSDEMYTGIASNYISVAPGQRFTGGNDLVENLVVQSGTYNKICGGIWGVNNVRKYKVDGDPSSGLSYTNNLDGSSVINLVIEGTTTVLGAVSGTCHQGTEFSGAINVTINGGTFNCDVYTVGPTGMMNRDGMAVLRINGGDFSGAWSFEPVIAGYINNAPAGRILDLSGWTGDKAGLAQIYNLAKGAATEFTMFKLPEGVSEGELASMSTETTVPAPAETDAPIGGDVTTAPNNNNNGGLIFGEDETDASVSVGGDQGNSMMGLIIGIAAGAVVVIGALVVVIVVMAKKNKGKKE